MNVLMMTLLYPNDMMDEVSRNAKDKIQNQINSYQHAFLDGIEANLRAEERLDVMNSLPVGIFPLQYRKLFLKRGAHDGGRILELGGINLPWFKQRCRARRAEKELLRWAKESEANRTVLIYTLYLPYLEAIQKVKKKYPDLKASVIVTDLPNEMGLASGRTGLMKKIEYARGNRSLAMSASLDGFVLLTEPMAKALLLKKKPYIVIEGLIRPLKESPFVTVKAAGEEKRPSAVLYTGTLERDLGIGDLLQAFEHIPECELWICGQGHMRAEVEAYASRCKNIRYLGFVTQDEALRLQREATLLINPRSPLGAFTRYSFPSKTLEYMRSGKPVLCYKLEGIPDEYDPYLCYIKEDGWQGIRAAVREALALSDAERERLGSAARDYVLQKKEPTAQCGRLMSFLRGL